MLRSQYRLALHAVAAVLIAGVAVVATGAGAGATTVAQSAHGKAQSAHGHAAAKRPGSYGGDATAGSIQFRVDRSPLPIPAVTDPFHVWVPYAETSIDSSGGSEGIASTVYPGQDAIGGPNLICEFEPPFCAGLPGGAPPGYPDWAHAQYPAHPDDSAQLSQKEFPGNGAPLGVTPNQATAHADRNVVQANALTAGAGLAGVVTVKSASSFSKQSFAGSALVLDAESVLKGVDIGGQLHINEIRSVTTGTIDGSKVGAATANTTVSGATVAGQPVTIDSTGIHVGNKGDNGLLKKTLNSALQKLASQGITVKSLTDTKTAKPRKIAAETGGLLLTWTQTVGGPTLPKVGGIENGDYVVTVSMGGAGINAFAGPGSPVPSFSLPSSPPLSAGSQAAPTASGGVPPSTGQAQTTTPTGQQPAVAGGTSPKNVALPTDLTNKRLKTLALVLLGYPLLMLIAAPFRAPSRLPRGG